MRTTHQHSIAEAASSDGIQGSMLTTDGMEHKAAEGRVSVHDFLDTATPAGVEFPGSGVFLHGLTSD